MSHATEFKSFHERERWYKVVQADKAPHTAAANWAIEVADTVLEADRARHTEEMKRRNKANEELSKRLNAENLRQHKINATF